MWRTREWNVTKFYQKKKKLTNYKGEKLDFYQIKNN
jgi:hypothetical protein